MYLLDGVPPRESAAVLYSWIDAGGRSNGNDSSPFFPQPFDELKIEWLSVGN